MNFHLKVLIVNFFWFIQLHQYYLLQLPLVWSILSDCIEDPSRAERSIGNTIVIACFFFYTRINYLFMFFAFTNLGRLFSLYTLTLHSAPIIRQLSIHFSQTTLMNTIYKNSFFVKQRMAFQNTSG